MRNLSRSAPLTGGGTISGDLTIDGDLTVNGGGGFSYSEVLTGDMKITNTAASTAFEVEQNTGAGTAVLIDQNADAQALTIDSESTTYAAVAINGRYGLYVTSDISGGYAAKFTRNIAESGSQPLVDIIDNHTSNAETTLRVQQDGSGDILNLFDGSTEVFTVLNGGNVGIGTDSPDSILNLESTTDTILNIDTYNASASTFPQLVFRRSDSGTAGTISATESGDYLGAIFFRGGDSGNNFDNGAYIRAIQNDSAGTYVPTKLEIATYSGSAAVTNIVLDSNSRISLSNNDSGTGNTIFGHTAGNAITGGYSTFIGYHAGLVHTSGGYNMAIGYGAMDDTNAGNNSLGSTENIFIGVDSGGGTWADTASSYNVALGSYTMDAILDGANYNVSIGYQALTAHTEGDYNTVVGAQAGLDSTTGAINTLIGFRAGYDIVGGAENTFVGASAGLLTTAVVGATLIGREAGGGGIITTDANYTTAVGFQSLYALTGGQWNTAVGYKSQNANQTGDGLTSVGYNSLLLATGNDNTAMGRESLASNTSGAANTGLGIWAGFGNATGSGNVYVGSSAGRGTANQSNSNNVAIGYDAMLNVTTGSYNTAVGCRALDASTTGEKNTAIGDASLGAIVGGYNNTAVGWNAGLSLTTGVGNNVLGLRALDAAAHGESTNIAIGNDALGAAKENVAAGGSHAHTLDNNIAIGDNAMLGGDLGTADSVLSFNDNIAIGVSAMDGTGSQQASENIAIGKDAMGGSWAGTCVKNIAIGSFALDAAMNDSNSNVAIGSGCMSAMVSGDNNIAIGSYSDSTYKGAMETSTLNINCVAIGTAALQLANHTASDGSIAIGFAALRELAPSSGSQYDSAQTAIGHLALTSTTSGTQNTAVGFQSLYSNTTGLNNTALGHKALRTNVDGDNNVAVGSNSLYTFEASSDGDGCNTAVGANSGYLVSTGQDNVLIGENAGWINSGTSLTTGSGNTLVGYQAAIGAADATNRTAIGNGTTAQSNNSVTLGNADVTDIFMGSDKGAAVRADNNKIVCQGVEFPDTQSASGDANILDDYEEGDWTPVLADVSGNNATMHANTAGAYVKIGRQVTLTARLTCSSLGSCSGNMKITGLPFTVGNHNKFYNSVSIGYGENLAIPDDTSISGYGGQNTTTIVLWNWDDAAGGTALQHSEISADGTFFITTTYFID